MDVYQIFTSFSDISNVSFLVEGAFDGLVSTIQGMLPDLLMLVFFQGIIEFLRSAITDMATDGLKNMIGFCAIVAVPMVTFWIMINGYRIMTGRSQASLMAFVLNAAKVIVIITIATSGSIFNQDIQDMMWDWRDDFASLVSDESGNVYENIDKNLMLSQAMMILADKLNAETDASAQGTQNSLFAAKWVSTFGSAGPAMVGGGLSILNEFALAFCIMFFPLMVLALMFEETKQMFWQWLKFSLATMFSAGALAAATSIAMKMTAIYGAAIIIAVKAGMTGSADAQGNATSFIQSAMQLGGLGTLLTVMIVSVPAVVYNFFAGNLGFSPFNAFTAQGQKSGQSGGVAPGGTAPQGTQNNGGMSNGNQDNRIDVTHQTTEQYLRHMKQQDAKKQ